MLFKNILVPYDGSHHAKRAFKISLDMAKRYQSKISMVSVLTGFYTGYWYVDSRIQSESFKKASKNLNKDFADLAIDVRPRWPLSELLTTS